MLAYSTCVGDWIINSCSNCGTDVYITHVVKGDRTFVLPGVLVRRYFTCMKIMYEGTGIVMAPLLPPPSSSLPLSFLSLPPLSPQQVNRQFVGLIQTLFLLDLVPSTYLLAHVMLYAIKQGYTLTTQSYARNTKYWYICISLPGEYVLVIQCTMILFLRVVKLFRVCVNRKRSTAPYSRSC